MKWPKKWQNLSRELGIPLVATNDVHYVNPDDAEAQDVLLAVQTRKIVSDTNRMTMIESPDYYRVLPKKWRSYLLDIRMPSQTP